MPEEDKLIGQLLHLRAGPDKLREKANVFPGRHDWRPENWFDALREVPI